MVMALTAFGSWLTDRRHEGIDMLEWRLVYATTYLESFKDLLKVGPAPGLAFALKLSFHG